MVDEKMRARAAESGEKVLTQFGRALIGLRFIAAVL
jgi:hypothetical protein